MNIEALWHAAFHWGRYYGLCTYDAEEGAQEVTLRAWRTGATFASPGALHGFAKRAMRNWIIDCTRRAEYKCAYVSYEAWNGSVGPPEAQAQMDVLAWLMSQCRDAVDQVTLCAMALEYTAMEQARHWPDLFPCAADASHARRLLRDRLRRAASKFDLDVVHRRVLHHDS